MTSFYSFKTIIMRNYLLSLISRLTVKDSLPVAAQGAYAVLTPDQTLTFYYDNQRNNHQDHGRIYDMPKPYLKPAWAGTCDKPQENIKHVVFDASFAKYRPTSTSYWFSSCINLQDIEGIRNLNTERVYDMSFMFSNCYALTSLDVSKFNTEKVYDMGGMFSYCEALTSLDVSNFNTQNVIYMRGMFYNCKALTSLDVSKFKTENVIYLQGMFQFCKAVTALNLSNFNTEKVTDMSYMFFGCESLTTIFCNSDWIVDRHVYAMSMFENCTKLKGTNSAYNGKKTGIWMANPTTGYFTSKTTGIDHVKTADQAGDGKAYDLSGRRVNESYKGILIKNGKKYIQK